MGMLLTAIRDFQYDDARNRLDVVYRSGWLHRYFNVPAGVASGLVDASDKDQFVSQRIRHRYAVRRLPHGQPDYFD